MKQRVWLVLAMIAGFFILWAVAARLTTPTAMSRAGDFDLIGMLREMHKTNTETQTVNDRILTALADVEQQAARVKSVDQKMADLADGLVTQQQALERLKALTAEQAKLSSALRDLTAAVGPNAKGLAETAQAEAQDLTTMKQTAATLMGRMNRIGSINEEIAGKLERADLLSADILADMP